MAEKGSIGRTGKTAGVRQGRSTNAGAARWLGCCLAGAVLLAGCGGSGLSESSTCQQFLAASQQDQQSIVEQLAGKYQKPAYATPLGMPEVPYYCSSHPNITLKQFFSFAQGG
jgi:hypothetical protein